MASGYAALSFPLPPTDMARHGEICQKPMEPTFEKSAAEANTTGAQKDTDAMFGDEPWVRGVYRDVLKPHDETITGIIDALATEFGKLVKCNDRALIRKAVTLQHLGLYGDKCLDFSKVDDAPCQETEHDIACLVLRAWGDHKHSRSWRFVTSAELDGQLGAKALGDKKELEEWFRTDARGGKEYRAYEEIKQWIAEGVGASETGLISGGELKFKPIQSLYNKCFVRRGQMNVSVAGDVMRSNLLVDGNQDASLLDRIVAFLWENAGCNFDSRDAPEGVSAPEVRVRKSLDKMNLGVADFLREAAKLKAVEVVAGRKIIFYRLKANSSQKGKPQLYNLNFFVEAPTYYSYGHQHTFVAFELQIGDKGVIQGLRQDHEPYERARILEALPLLQRVLDGDNADPDVDYDELNERLRNARHISVRQTVSLKMKDETVSWRPETQLKSFIINDMGLQQKQDGQWDGMVSPCSVLWQLPLDGAERYMVDDFVADICDQMWGGVGLIFALACAVGPYICMVSERFFAESERTVYKSEGGVHLIKEGYNMSRFARQTLLPVGADILMLVAFGRLHKSGHSFNYKNSRVALSVVDLAGDVRLPPTAVHISGGQGQSVSVNDDGTIKPGQPFRWLMTDAGNGAYTFQAAEGPHEGKYISVLRGSAYSDKSKLELTGYAHTWKVDTGDVGIFYDWVRAGPFSMGIRDATRWLGGREDGEWDIYWRWQSSHYHLASKKRGKFGGDEAFFIVLADEDGQTPAVPRSD